jgi:hypothetical protein
MKKKTRRRGHGDTANKALVARPRVAASPRLRVFFFILHPWGLAIRSVNAAIRSDSESDETHTRS